VKLYVAELGTERMIQLADPSNGHMFAILGLARVEYRAAVRRRQRMGDIPDDTANALIEALEEHLRTLYLIQPVTEAVVAEAAALTDRHPLRAYDAMQLAGCLALRSRLVEQPTFVCADQQLMTAARQEGLAGLNPAADSPSSGS
jgi:predicted nucleic acid-binding protein